MDRPDVRDVEHLSELGAGQGQYGCGVQQRNVEVPTARPGYELLKAPYVGAQIVVEDAVDVHRDVERFKVLSQAPVERAHQGEGAGILFNQPSYEVEQVELPPAQPEVVGVDEHGRAGFSGRLRGRERRRRQGPVSFALCRILSFLSADGALDRLEDLALTRHTPGDRFHSRLAFRKRDDI